MKILIVDDEYLARERLIDLIHDIDPGCKVREADNGLSALSAIENDPPDVVLLDIRMPVMDGLETAYHLTNIDNAPAVIFTTAYQDHAIQAFEVHAVDYLLKPIKRERLEASLARCNLIKKSTIAAISESTEDEAPRTHLSVSSYGKIQLIPVEEIRYLKAEQKYVVVGWEGRETLIDDSLKSLEKEHSGMFLRIHRNALIAPKFIESMQKGSDGSFYLYLKGVKNGLPVSRRHMHDVRHALKHLGIKN